MSYADYFSETYQIAKNKFCQAVEAANFYHESHFINSWDLNGRELSIDIGISKAKKPLRSIVISSGLHGVEGFLGSAIQSALLEDQKIISSIPKNTQLILIHSLNPYGFAWRRRCNEDNVDLNRNFLISDERYEGCPINYPKFEAFLNPKSPPSRFNPFLIEATWLILRYGMKTLMNTIPVGQYDYPKGLFFGGNFPSKTQEILLKYLPDWMGQSSQVIHLDIHTGLGKWGKYQLLLDLPKSSASYHRLKQIFEPQLIKTFSLNSERYQSRGGLGSWCQELLHQHVYDFLTVEFGTYSVIQVLQALRAENRAYWWGKSQCNYDWAVQRLVEVFSPKSRVWKERCVVQGMKVCKKVIFSECFR